MIFYNTKTKEYPRHIGDLELLGWSQNEPLPRNWVKVKETESPVISENQKVKEIMPEFIDGIWQMAWEIIDLTDEEKADIQKVRDDLAKEMRGSYFLK